MSSSRRAKRRRRHHRYGKPVYPPRPKNGLTPTAITIDEWTSPYLNEDRPHVITSEMIDWKNAYVSLGDAVFTPKKEELVRKFRTKYFIE